MITEEYHVSPDGGRTGDGNGQSWTTINFLTDAVINGVKIPLWKFGAYERTISLEVSVDGAVVHTTSVVLDADTQQQTKFFQSFDVQVSVNAGSVLVLRIFGIGGGGENSVYTYRTRYYYTGFAMPFGYFYMKSTTDWDMYETECILDISYAPIWVVDGQNDGYARIVGYDAVEFTEFEKDEFGYPLNWGVWKLDDNNEGYPWPTGYEDYIVRGLPVKVMSQDKTHWINASVGVFTNEKIIGAYIKLIGDDEDADNGNAVDPEQVFATTENT